MLEKFPAPSPNVSGTGFLVPVEGSPLPPTSACEAWGQTQRLVGQSSWARIDLVRNSFARSWETQTRNEENYADLL